MDGLKETKNHIKTTVTLGVGLERGTLLDFETTGIPPHDREYEVITLGYFHKDKLVITQRKTRDKAPFYREVIATLKNLPTPYFAYNSDFERRVMEMELGLRTRSAGFVDLMQRWREKASIEGIKWPRLDELISEPEDYFKGLRVSGKDVPGLWKAYLAGGSENLLKMIMEHCLSDLLREMILLLRFFPK